MYHINNITGGNYLEFVGNDREKSLQVICVWRIFQLVIKTKDYGNSTFLHSLNLLFMNHRSF